MVAWQFTARDCKKRTRLRRGGYDRGWKERSSTSNRERASRPTQTVPYGTGLFLNATPGSELPGLRRAQSSRYLHLVPSGQKAQTPSEFSVEAAPLDAL